MLIVENGTGLANANAYASLAQVSAYWAARGNVEWFGGAYTSAQGTATVVSNPTAGDIVQIGSRAYTFVTSLSTNPTVPNEVLIGVTPSATRDNLLAALMGTPGAGMTYSAGTQPSPDVYAVASGAAAISLTAYAGGEAGNSVVTVSDNPAVTFTGAALSGGTQTRPVAEQEAAIIAATSYIDARWGFQLGGWPLTATQALAFPRTGLCDTCTRGQPMPPTLVQATAEYALRALNGPLAPDPVVDDSGRAVTRRREKVGPIEEEYQFSDNAGGGLNGLIFWRPYPAADALMACMLTGRSSANGRAVRN